MYNAFCKTWAKSGYYEQRIAHLYGYYSTDPNFPEGVRCNVEAIYDPPQEGSRDSVKELNDPKRYIVD